MKPKFKIGDRVIRKIGNFAGMTKGDIDEVVEIYDQDNNNVKLKKYVEPGEVWHDVQFLESHKEENEI